MNSAWITFGLSPGSLARIRDTRRAFAGFEHGKVYFEAQLKIISEELKEAVKREFAPHDRGPLVAGDGREERTIDTIEAKMNGFEAEVSIGGAGAFIEYGVGPHDITPFNADVLKFHVDDEDEPLYRPFVHSPGYAGDPFLERAMGDVVAGQSLETKLSKIAYLTFTDIAGFAGTHGYRTGENWTGERYLPEGLSA